MTITSVDIRRLHMPLHRPFHLSYRTFEEFEPFYVEIRDDSGRHGFGEGHISPGSSAETRAGGWAHLGRIAAGAIGTAAGDAKVMALDRLSESPVATTALVTALECLEGAPLLEVSQAVSLPIHSHVNSIELDDIPAEIKALLDEGYKTFKIKVGKDLEADLVRVATIQEATNGRATFRIDANRAYDRDQGCRFASRVDAEGVELFEQPCPAADWDANAAVAKASAIPVMLDEPICTLDDIDRAADIEGVGFCKPGLASSSASAAWPGSRKAWSGSGPAAWSPCSATAWAAKSAIGWKLAWRAPPFATRANSTAISRPSPACSAIPSASKAAPWSWPPDTAPKSTTAPWTG